MLADILKKIFNKKKGRDKPEVNNAGIADDPDPTARFRWTDEQLEQSRALGRGPALIPQRGQIQPEPMLSERERLEAEAAALRNKDYSAPMYVDPSGKETKRKSYDGIPNTMVKEAGKDRDTDHNWWDSVKSGLLGAGFGFLRGGIGGALAGGVGGAIHGAVDRNADEQMIDRNWRIPRVQEKLNAARESEMYDQQAQLKQAQIEQTQMQPVLRNKQLEIQAEIAQRKAELAARQQDWKEKDRADYWDWEEIKHQARQSQNDRMYELAVRRQTEIEKRNAVLERQGEERLRQGNERIGIAKDRIGSTGSAASGTNTSIAKRIAEKGEAQTAEEARQAFIDGYVRRYKTVPDEAKIKAYLESRGLTLPKATLKGTSAVPNP